MKNHYTMLDGDQNDDFKEISLRLASPDKIRAWSHGEVRMPETINYRTFRPEQGGLFCAKIFGPMKDYECMCGKYKRIKYRGVVCEKCGVEVTESKVRRKRMGHIDLACPVAHILFFKALPSRIGLVLDLTMRDIERILYFEVYVVIDPGRLRDLDRGQLLRVEEYQELQRRNPGLDWKKMVGIGAEGIRDFLKAIDLAEESAILQEELKAAASDTRRKKVYKRLKIIEDFQKAQLRPEWMVLEVLPVLPPDLRPLVQLEGGRFTTSDLNDLYRRVINRNNRLRRLMDLDAPDVIINNEKRMLQESVDSLLDNGRRGKPSLGANRRPLKSMVDLIKGKSGRFRQNLLGKRVDFSGRSVIVVGPDLKLHQCGLPKKMALDLFRPFVFKRLVDEGEAQTVKQARQMVDAEEPPVWGALEKVISQHPVLLNRAPTLHRLGVQAFEPVLTEGKAIQLHPLVCVAFNADFDGDQMAVHVPLHIEAQAEARVLMLSSNNILAPANGEPIIVPTQDVVLGLYYATRERSDAKGAGMRFADVSEAERALASGAVDLHAPVSVRMEADMTAHAAGEYEEAGAGDAGMTVVETTVGRALLKQFLPPELPFAMINRTLKKSDITRLIKESFRRCGHRSTVIFCDQLMRFGFEKATRAGISVCMDDMIIPPEKAGIIESTEAKIRETHEQFRNGLLTEDERYNKSVDYWDKAGDQVSRVMMKHISSEPVFGADGRAQIGADGAPLERESFNSIYMMADSGARGSETQIKQLAGMRGLMTKPDGRIMENAITANFCEGLSVLQYFISTHGARKGLSDTALKTANSGYLTRRLVDVTQDVVITEEDCDSKEGISLRPVIKDGNEVVPLFDRIVGRTLAADVLHPHSREVIYPAGTYVTEDEARNITEAGVDEATVRSPVRCQSERGLCAKCYGRDLGRGGLVCLGEAVGVVAAQSIGEPGTQLTMRTFHIGGAASREVVAESINALNSGKVKLSNAVRYVTNADGDLVVVSRGGEMSVQEKSGRERERYRLQYGQVIKVKDGDEVAAGDVLSQRDPMARPIIAEYEGKVRLVNLEMGVNAREQTDETTGLSVITIIENKQGSKKAKQPQIQFQNSRGEDIKIADTAVSIALPPGAILSVRDGQKARIGDSLAKIPQRTGRSRDITGGLPRVAELFEAREPKEPAILAKAAGRVSLRGWRRGKQMVAIVDDTSKETHDIAPGRKILHTNDEVKKGDIIAEETEEHAEIVAGISGLYTARERPPAKGEASGRAEPEEIRADLLNLCRPESLSPRLQKWGDESVTRLIEDARSPSPEKLRRAARAIERDLRAIVNRAGSDGALQGELKKWRDRIRRVFKSAPESLSDWAQESAASLKSGASYESLIAAAAAALEKLEKMNGEDASARSDRLRLQIEYIKGEHARLIAEQESSAAAAAEAAFAKEASALFEKVQAIVAAISAKEISPARVVEIVSAEFHHVSKGRAILVQDGNQIERGEEIVDGDSNPREILEMRGIGDLVEHIVGEVQEVYRLQGVNINDKHIEVIINQMTRSARVIDAGDSSLIPGDYVTRSRLKKINDEMDDSQKKATAEQILLGITKASLSTDSFISAASFQETSRVLTEAAVEGKKDPLKGLKENVIVGRLVPAGTGFVHRQKEKEHEDRVEAEDMLRENLRENLGVDGDPAPAEPEMPESSEVPPAAEI